MTGLSVKNRQTQSRTGGLQYGGGSTLTSTYPAARTAPTQTKANTPASSFFEGIAKPPVQRRLRSASVSASTSLVDGAKRHSAPTSTSAPSATAGTPDTNTQETTVADQRTTHSTDGELPTPVNADALQNLLTPDDDDANFVVSGFRRGFQLGYEGPKISRNCNNSTLANANPLAVAQKLQSEIKLGRIAGPYPKPPFTPFICNPLSLREKSEKGKYRLLHDLSYPHNELSVNANIPEDYAKVKYATVRDAITLISKS